MISDAERREVASRLRALDVHEWDDSADEVDSLETAIGCAIGQDWQDQAWWERLADLIDVPTTTLDFTEATRTVHGEEVRGWECRECGQSCEEMYGEYEFCPHCGRKVVEP